MPRLLAALKDQIFVADGLLLATPECNNSLPPRLIPRAASDRGND